MENFLRSINNLQDSLKQIKSSNIDLSKGIEKEKILTDYKALREDYLKRSLESCLKSVRKYLFELHQLNTTNPANSKNTTQIQELVKDLKLNDIPNLEKSVKEIKGLLDKLQYPKTEKKLSLKIGYIPEEIKSDILADIKELEKCFNNDCFRSATIICGRILETALHRKYYETTGMDILEKNPGIGLGKLIAKLSEKNVAFDPGLTQQIHLINQIRVFSVHTKKEAFYPSKAQTHAMILYTMDVLDKMF